MKLAHYCYMSFKPPANLLLPAPADLCRTPIARRYKLIRVRHLEADEWEEVPTRPIRPSLLLTLRGT